MTQANTSSRWPGYQVNQYSNICANPKCPRGKSHWAGFGKRSWVKCDAYGKEMRRIRGEPRG